MCLCRLCLVRYDDRTHWTLCPHAPRPPRGMWQHHCPAERTTMAVGAGEPCNWCGASELSPVAAPAKVETAT